MGNRMSNHGRRSVDESQIIFSIPLILYTVFLTFPSYFFFVGCQKHLLPAFQLKKIEFAFGIWRSIIANRNYALLFKFISDFFIQILIYFSEIANRCFATISGRSMAIEKSLFGG